MKCFTYSAECKRCVQECRFQALNSAPARNLAVLDNTNQPFAVPKQLCAELYCRVLANHKIECRNQTLKRIIFLTQSYQTVSSILS